MAKTDTIHMRISPEVKSNAEAVLSQLGMTTADAINIFLVYRINQKNLQIQTVFIQ